MLYAGGDDGFVGVTGATDAVARWDGFLQTEYPQLAEQTRPSRVAGGDVDGDGLADIVIASDVFNALWVDYSDTPYGGHRRECRNNQPTER